MGSTCGRLIRTLNGSSPTTAKEYVAFPPFHTKNENYFIERGIFTVMNRMYLVIDRLVQAWVKVVGVLAAHKKKDGILFLQQKRTLPRCIGQGHNGK